MQSNRSISAALLSMLWPGLGQFAQGRFLKGLLYFSWTTTSAAAIAFGNYPFGMRLVLVFEFAVVCMWAIVDAYLGTRPAERPAAC